MATNDKVIELRDRSKTIQNVVKVIQNLASQTHLLALNATIEAARAGKRDEVSQWWRQRLKSLRGKPRLQPRT